MKARPSSAHSGDRMFDEHEQSNSPPQLGRALEVMRRVWAVDHAARHLSRTMETHLGLTGPQRLVIRVVGQRPGISSGELCALLHLDASTLSGHLQTLTESGLVERRAAATDARKVAITLTPKGRRLDVKTPGTVEAAVEATIGGFGDVAIEQVERFLERLVEELKRQATECETASVQKSKKKRRRA
jgi:MarR family transcriptional regulator, organic hydroperoxide resistance regulator